MTTTTVAPVEPGPLTESTFADPFVLTADDGQFAYATNDAGMNILVAPLVNGSELGVVTDALPQVASWSEPGYVWAPSVMEIDGQYVMYYTTRESASQRQCISVATSSSPTGPFVDTSTEPLVCDYEQGGSIDPSPVQDTDGQLSLLWKSDGNCCGSPSVIYSQPLDATGLNIAGEPVELIRNDQAWEGSVVEAPSMVQVGDTWYLFYSGNDWNSAEYATGYAECSSPSGPCVKPTQQPVLISDAERAGPGGGEAIVDESGNVALVFAAWDTSEPIGFFEGGTRQAYIEEITIIS